MTAEFENQRQQLTKKMAELSQDLTGVISNTENELGKEKMLNYMNTEVFNFIVVTK